MILAFPPSALGTSKLTNCINYPPVTPKISPRQECRSCSIPKESTRSKFGARGEHGEHGKDVKHGDLLRFSNWDILWFTNLGVLPGSRRTVLQLRCSPGLQLRCALDLQPRCSPVLGEPFSNRDVFRFSKYLDYAFGTENICIFTLGLLKEKSKLTFVDDFFKIFIACLLKGSQEQSFFLSTYSIYGIFCDDSKNYYVRTWNTWSWVSSRWENVKWLLRPCPQISPRYPNDVPKILDHYRIVFNSKTYRWIQMDAIDRLGWLYRTLEHLGQDICCHAPPSRLPVAPQPPSRQDTAHTSQHLSLLLCASHTDSNNSSLE